MASPDAIVDKRNLIKSFDVNILNTLTSEVDREKEINETGDLERYPSRNLCPYDIDSNHYGPIWFSAVIKKLPEEFHFELLRQIPVGQWDLAELLEVFSKELPSSEQCQSIKSSDPSSQIIGSKGLNSGSILHVASENHNRNPPKITCTYCRQNHPSNRCPIVKVSLYIHNFCYNLNYRRSITSYKCVSSTYNSLLFSIIFGFYLSIISL